MKYLSHPIKTQELKFTSQTIYTHITFQIIPTKTVPIRQGLPPKNWTSIWHHQTWEPRRNPYVNQKRTACLRTDLAWRFWPRPSYKNETAYYPDRTRIWFSARIGNVNFHQNLITSLSNFFMWANPPFTSFRRMRSPSLRSICSIMASGSVTRFPFRIFRRKNSSSSFCTSPGIDHHVPDHWFDPILLGGIFKRYNSAININKHIGFWATKNI